MRCITLLAEGALKVPFFVYIMVSTLEDKIVEIVNGVLDDQGMSDYFLVDVKLVGNRLEVYLDSDTSVHVDKCKFVSRQIESYLDEHQTLGEKYTLEVSSAGVGNPLQIPRQYIKNIDRDLEVDLQSGTTVKGLLLSADETSIVLKELKKVKEGKKNVKKEIDHTILYDDILKAIVKIRF